MYDWMTFEKANTLFQVLLGRELEQQDFLKFQGSYRNIHRLLYQITTSPEYICNSFRMAYDNEDYELAKALLGKMQSEQMHESTLGLDLEELINLKQTLLQALETRKLIHLHIPKTGGASLFTLLVKVLGYQFSLRLSEANQLKRQLQTIDATLQSAPHLLNPIRLISGHICIDDIIFLQQQRCKLYTFTILRNPVNTLVSTYRYWLSMKNPEVPYIQDLQRQNLSFSQFIRSPDFASRIANPLCSFLITSQDREAGLLNSSGNQTEALEVLLSNLKQYFDRVGILEDLEPFLAQFCADLGVRSLPIPEFNVSSKNYLQHPTRFKPVDPLVVGEEDFDYIQQELCALDWQVYQAVQLNSTKSDFSMGKGNEKFQEQCDARV